MNLILLFLLGATLSSAQKPAQTQANQSSELATSIIALTALPTAYPLSLTAQDPAVENQIRDTFAHYPLAIDGKNFAALDLVFTADAVANYSAPLNVLTGLPQIQAVLEQALAPVLSQHALSTLVIEIEIGGSAARSVQYFTASQFGTGNKTGKVLYSYGQYQDNWVKVGDGWRIKHRNLVYMGPNIGDASVFS